LQKGPCEAPTKGVAKKNQPTAAVGEEGSVAKKNQPTAAVGEEGSVAKKNQEEGSVAKKNAEMQGAAFLIFLMDFFLSCLVRGPYYPVLDIIITPY
jgi:hypothetical protein